MIAARFVARTQRRNRRGSVAVLALLVTVTATAVLTLTTAWRRADTVVDRWTHTAIPYDRFVIAQLGPDEMRALPGVARADRQEFIPLMATDQNVHVDGQAMEMSSLDSTTIVLDGRIPDGDNPFDVLVDEMAASQLHLGVGDTIDVRFFAPDQNDAIIGGDYSHPHGLGATVTVAGIIRPWQEVTADLWLTPPNGSQAPHPTIAFPISLLDVHRDEVWRFGLAWPYAVQFEPGADPARFEKAAKAAIGAGVPDYIPAFELDPPQFPPKLAQIEAPVHTQVGVLFALVLVVVLASAFALVAATRATERQFERDRTALDALGTTRGSMLATALWRTSPALVGGLALAVPMSWLLSDRLPIGLAARVEPSPGRVIDVGVTIIVLTVWAAVVAVCALSAVTTRRTTQPGRHRHAIPPLGVRQLDLALASSRSARTRGHRAAMLSGFLAVATVVAAGTVVAGLDDVEARPATRGIWGDLFVGNSNFPLGDEERAAVAALDGVRSASTLAIVPQLVIDGQSVTLYALEPSPTARMRKVLRGRMPEAPREVMLGAQLASALHKDLGDIVTIAGQNPPADFTVVGIGPAPSLGDAGLGKTIVVSSTAITDDWGGTAPVMLAVELDDPTKIDEVTAQLSHSTTDIVFDVVPGTVQNLFELRWLLLWAAMVLVLVGTLLAINASVAGDRRWRRDAAVLRAFGATPRDLLGIAGWLGIMRGALVGVVGTVAGVAIGVRAWSAIADSLGLPAPWRVPSLTVLAVLLPVAVFLLLAALTATRARTSRLTTSLRAE